MRGIAEWSIFCESTATELWILHRAGDISISIDEVDSSSDSDRTTLGIYKYLDVLGHDLVEVIAKRL